MLKFIADATLGKLTKWLRIMGYDTVYYRHALNDALLRKAADEGRVLLTRQAKATSRRYEGALLIVDHDCLPEQITEIMDKLALTLEPQRFFTRCINCNEELLAAVREEVTDKVPSYILLHYSEFRKCQTCGRIFWPGTHRDNMERFIQSHSHSYPL